MTFIIAFSFLLSRVSSVHIHSHECKRWGVIITSFKLYIPGHSIILKLLLNIVKNVDINFTSTLSQTFRYNKNNRREGMRQATKFGSSLVVCVVRKINIIQNDNGSFVSLETFHIISPLNKKRKERFLNFKKRLHYNP